MKSLKKKLLVSALCILPLITSGCDISINVDKDENNKNTNDTSVEEKESLLTESEAINIGRTLYDKLTEIYETSNLIPYCGYNYIQAITNASDEFSAEGFDNVKYLKTNFNSLDDLKNALRNYLSDDLIKDLVTGDVVTDLKNLKVYSNYLIKDNTLYCRAYTGAGYMTLYANNYEMTIKSIDEKEITFNIKSKYVKESASYECINAVFGNMDISGVCNSDEVEYKDTTFTISKNSNNNWVVTDFTLHE